MNRVMPALVLLTATIANGQSLAAVVSRAIAHSPELRALEAAVAEARADATLGDAFRPAASAATTPGYASGLPIAVLGQVPAIATIEAHRLLYDPSARADQIGASSLIDAAIARLESRRREIAQSAGDLYARVGADAVLLASAKRRVAASQTIAARTEALRREGRVRDLDVDRAALQVWSAKRNALQAQSRLELDQLRLNRLAGEAISVTVSEEKGLGDGVTTEQAQANDPEMRSLESRIEALRHAAGLGGRFFQPRVAAQIQYSRLFDRYRSFYLNFKPDDFSVGATVTLPLWTGGHRASTSARLEAQLEQLVAQRDARRTEIELAVREAEAELTQATAEAELAARGHAVAEETLRIAEEVAHEGRGEANDVPRAQIALADSDDDAANAHAHLAAARARLLILRGQLPGQ
jgi:outer membrane protein TolC